MPLVSKIQNPKSKMGWLKLFSRLKSYVLRIAYCVLFGALFAHMAEKPALADCACGGGELEIVFILDCSGSMNHMLHTLQEQIRRIVEVLEGQVKSLRVGAVAYRTKEYAGKQKKIDVFPFTADAKALTEFLHGQTAEGGGIEMVDDGLKAALDDFSWTKGTRKVAVLMGDEQAVPAMQPKCMELAKVFLERGMVLHAVTGSQTAWIYYSDPNATSWKQKLAGMSEETKKTFRLPFFDDLAEVTGGLSVSSYNSRELVLWLLAFGLGLDAKEAQTKIDMDKYLEWAKQRELAEAAGAGAPHATAEGAAAAPLLAWVRHRGEWQVPHRFAGLMTHLDARIALAGTNGVPAVGLLDENLERFPILYTSGHGALRWVTAEKRMLRLHLQRGGFLFADACCGDAAFTQSLREALLEIFPASKLERLPSTHPIYTCGHRLERVRRSQTPRTGKMVEAPPELWGLYLPLPAGPREEKAAEPARRLTVVFSPHDLGCAWTSRPLGVPCMHKDDDGIALSANILLWALTR